jgi:hypothetical protein
MDIQRFEQLVRDPGKTREDLENMKKNALAKGKPDFASIADEVLLQRFPCILRLIVITVSTSS